MKLYSKKYAQYLLLSSCLVGVTLPGFANQVNVTVNSSVPVELQQNKIRVNGKVMDHNNDPLPGVNIKIKGTELGVVTDIDGNYFIEVPNKKAILTFQYIGFEPTEIEVGNQININVNLKEITTDLNEVVVVGYGSQKKASVIGSISTIQPEFLQQGTSRAVSNNLAGQLAGVIAVQRSGEPGKDGSSFWIRGISSFMSGTSPLVLVDGIERSLDDINPAEIESFSVLKDASASAVYGVRGANGVILINTKRGEMGKPKINIHYEQGFTSPVKLPEYIGSADYLSLLDEINVDAGLGPLYRDVIEKYRTKADTDLYPDVNWMKAITKDHASNQRVNLSVNGGNEFIRYSLIGSYYGERGIFVRDKAQGWDSTTRLNKFNLRSNVDVNLTKTTVARISIGGYLQDNTEMASGSGSVLAAAFETPPYVYPTRYSSGEIPKEKSRSNPWAMATQEGFSTYTQSKIESLFSLEQDLKFLLPGLKIKGIFSFDRWSKSGVKRSKKPFYYAPATMRDDDGNLILGTPEDGQEFLTTEKLMDWGNKATYFEANLNYSQDFGLHHVEGLFLYNQRDYQNGDVVPYRRMGIAGRASYMFDSRYVAEFNFGYNGSENFAKGKRFGFFPSVALGWLLSEEKFMERYKDVFSKIKFRGSWGLVGNDQLSGRRFSYLSTIDEDKGGYHWGVSADNWHKGYHEGDFGSPEMTWETVEKINVGLELGLWNAFELQVDWFTERRRDIFMQRNNIPTAAGFLKFPWANFGKVDNKGIDLSLNYNKRINKDLFIGARGTFTYAKNKIIEQDEAPGLIGTKRSSTGLPVGQLFGLVAERLFTDEDFENVEIGKLKPGIPQQNFSSDLTLRPGDIKYIDMDGDGEVTTKDVAPIGGTYDPQIVYGFGLNASYKNFDFNVFFQGNAKTHRFIGGRNFLPGSGLGNILSNYQDRWTVENPRQDVFYPRLYNGVNENNNQQSTWWLRDMSMMRMKDIEIGYNLPRSILNHIGLSAIRFYIKGTNLLTFSKFDLWDPEVNSSNGAQYPIMKSVSFGLDINF